jgi:hypothetical protein
MSRERTDVDIPVKALRTTMMQRTHSSAGCFFILETFLNPKTPQILVGVLDEESSTLQ